MENLDNRAVCETEPHPKDNSTVWPVANVDECMIAVNDESADGLAGVRVLHQCGPGEHGTFTQCRAVSKVAG